MMFLVTGLLLVSIAFACFYRVFAGPTIGDRIVAANVIGSKTLVILVLIAYIYEQKVFIDISIMYAMLQFLLAVIAAKFLETGKVV